MDSMIMDLARRYFDESIAVKQAFLNDPVQMSNLVEAAKLCVECYKRGNKLLIAGNGGSAADAQHFAGELVSRFNYDRPPLSALALTTDTSILTAIGNDYGYDEIFVRQLRANALPGDIFIAISTSGNSLNILKAIETARELKVGVIGLSGFSGGKMHGYCNYCICVPSKLTPRIQECHIAIEHWICEYLEYSLFPKG